MDVRYGLAKLTLSLRVTGVRADGYHLLESEMVTLDLADRLVFDEGDALSLGGPAHSGSVGAGEDNLVRRALRAVGRRAAVRLEKHIPAGAGLGGGSADAAAVLRWAGCDDVGVAVALGADVPFCVNGGRAIVRGIGEVVEPLLPLPQGDDVFTVVTPPFPVSTAAVYAEWDRLGGPSAGANDLERPALSVEPRLLAWRDRLGAATGCEPVLAGSGSSWWVPGAFPDVQGAVIVRCTTPAEMEGG